MSRILGPVAPKSPKRQDPVNAPALSSRKPKHPIPRRAALAFTCLNMLPTDHDRGPQQVFEKCSFITSLTTNDLRRLLSMTRSGLAGLKITREEWPPQLRYTNTEFLWGLEFGCWVCTAVHRRFNWLGKDSDLRSLGPNHEFCRVNWARQRVISHNENYDHDVTNHLT